MRFCANISMLFTEAPYLERFDRAAQAGFSAVESWWPDGADPDQVVEAVSSAGVAVELLNFAAGDVPAGDRGLAGLPDRSDEFLENVPVAVELAERIGCRKLNALIGLEIDPQTAEEQLELAAENVRVAARAAERIGADVMIEQVNRADNGPYLLPTVADAVAFIERVERPNVRLHLDLYHVQRTEGNITETLRRHANILGHVQIADCPGRGEPGTGEINYRFVLAQIDAVGYGGRVGLEYVPSAPTTEQGLMWMEQLGVGR